MSRIEPHHGLNKWLRSPPKLVLIGFNLVVFYLLWRWVTENIQIDMLLDHIKRIPVWALLGSIALNLTVLAMYGKRMALLLNRDFHTGFSIINVGFALNTVMPLRLGDAMKMYISHKLYKTPLVGIFAASVAEKLADITYLILLGVVVAVFSVGALIQTNILYPAVFLVLLCSSFIVLLRLYIVQVVKLLPKKGRMRRTLIELHKHARDYSIKHILTISFGIWTLNIAIMLFSFNTYLPDLRISLLDAATLLLILSFAIAVPSAPAGIGLFEAGIVVYLTQKLGVNTEAALAVATVFHLVNTVPQLAMASWLLWRRKSHAQKNISEVGR
jgi:hypothetical protein